MASASGAIVALRDHLLEGRLTLEEFTERAELALRAIVGRDLDRVTSNVRDRHRSAWQCRRLVPEGIDVDVSGGAIIGHRRDWGRDVSMSDAPTLHVTVLGLLGTVDVWRVPRDVVGEYGSIVDKVRDVHRAAALPAAGASSDRESD